MEFKHIAEGIRARLQDRMSMLLETRRWAAPTTAEAEAIGELRARVRRLEVPTSATPISATSSWRDHCAKLSNHIENNDCRRFLTWPEVRLTMFIAHAAYVRFELEYLKSLPEWRSRWRPALEEVRLGSPSRYIWAPYSSANLVHHAFQLSKWEEESGRRVDDMETIFEFGGGYGSMCRLAHSLGFRGQYLILDLEPFCSLQEYFLSSIGLPQVSMASNYTKNGFLATSDIPAIAEHLTSPSDRSLFIATWSLSESPLGVREEVEPLINRCGHLLVSFQDRFEGIDNNRYFSELGRVQKGKVLKIEQLAHLPGNSMLFGVQDDVVES